MPEFDANPINWNSIQAQLNSRKRKLLDEHTYRKNAVLVPLIHTTRGLEVLFEKRAKTLRRQAGEICFPGGHIEPTDVDERAAAIRETSEELQIPENSIRILGDLDIFVLNGMILYPFVGLIEYSEPISPNPDEVEYTFTVALKQLLQMEPIRHDVSMSVKPDDTFPFHLIPGGKQYAWRVGRIPEYFYEDTSHVIWGLTARILRHFLERIRETSTLLP